MGRVGRALCGVGLLAATLVVATPALARGDDPDRQARRHELRQQLQAERERWRGHERGRGVWGPPPGYAPGSGYAAPPGGGWGPGPPGAGGPYPASPAYAPPPWYGAPPGYAPAPGYGGGPGSGGGHRLSPDERRALRQELRQHRP